MMATESSFFIGHQESNSQATAIGTLTPRTAWAVGPGVACEATVNTTAEATRANSKGGMLGPRMTVEAGLRIGRYQVGRKLGQGGFGVLYVARDVELDRDVALKFLRPEHLTRPQVVQRFLQEARSAAKINHAGIVTVFECGQVAGTNTRADGTVYIAMELLQGESLGARIKRERRLAPALAIGICRQVTAALGAAHRSGIVHRDLKPDNIFLVPDPAVRGGERVKILDFGIAKLADGQLTGSVRTHSSMVLGTPMYMSPEQCKSSAKVDHRSDIYATGCILYELLTGQTPYDGDAGELIAKHQLAAVPAPRAVFPELSQGLDTLLRQMLAKAPDERPASMEVVDDALAACEGPASKLLPPAPLLPPRADREVMPTASTMFEGERTQTATKSPPWKLIGGAGAVIALGVILAIAVTGRGGDEPEDKPTTVAAVGSPVAMDAAAPTAIGSSAVVIQPTIQVDAGAPLSTADVTLECSKLAADRQWAEVLACSDRLASLDPARAKELRASANLEIKAEAAARGMEEALNLRNYTRARTELDRIPRDSVYRSNALARFSAAVEDREPVARKQPVDEPIEMPPAQPDCDAAALRAKGDDHMATGMDAAALAAFEKSMACRPDPALVRKAYMAACRSKNTPKAKLYFARIPPSMHASLAQICIRLGISVP